MEDTLTTSQAVDALYQDENAGWSLNGARALVEYLEQYEEDCDTELEMDVVAIRCDFSEYSDLQDWHDGYGAILDFEGCEDQDDKDEVIREYITDNGQLIEFDGGIIVSSF